MAGCVHPAGAHKLDQWELTGILPNDWAVSVLRCTGKVPCVTPSCCCQFSLNTWLANTWSINASSRGQ